MKAASEMSYRELVAELHYMASVLDDPPHYHAAYIADLADA